MQVAQGPSLVCRSLEPFAAHLFTTRHWPLGSRTASADDEAPWSAVADAMAVPAGDLLRARQVHGAAVATGRRGRTGRPEADILVSDDARVALAVQVADCAPVLIADRRTGTVAAAHAGWRGLAAAVPAQTVAALARQFGSRPSDLFVAIGPSIGACCCEVGGDVRSHFNAAGFTEDQLTRWFLPHPASSARNPSLPGLADRLRTGRWFFDLWASACEQFTGAGVPAEQVFAAELCTASHPHTFCSYRRDGASAGRMAGAIRRGRASAVAHS